MRQSEAIFLRHRTLIATGVGICFLETAVISVSYLTNLSLNQQLMWISVVQLALCSMVLLRRQARFDITDALNIFTLAFAWFFPVRGIYISLTYDYALFLRMGSNLSFVVTAQFVAFIGLCATLVGYISKSRLGTTQAHFLVPFSEHDPKLISKGVRIVAALAIMGFGTFILRNGFDFGRGGSVSVEGTTAYTYASLQLLGPALILYFFSLGISKQPGKLKYIVFLAVCSTVFGLFTLKGSRYPVVVITLALIILGQWKERKGAKYFLLGVVAIVMYISIVGAARHSLSLAKFELSAILEQFHLSSYAANIFSSSGDANILDTFSLVYNQIPEVLDYQYGKTMAGIFVQFIPRAIWPGKPLFASQIYMHELMPQYDGVVIYLGSILSDLTLNFGLAGIVLGMFMFGRILKVLNLMRGFPASNVGKMIYAVSVPIIPFMVRGEFVGTSVWYLTFLLPILCVLRYSQVRH